MPPVDKSGERGGALLAVLWLSAALSAIAFTLAMSVRVEFDRAALNVSQTRAYYLAAGAIEITVQRLLRPRSPSEDREQDPLEYPQGQRFLSYSFPAGTVVVEVIGETGKLGVNRASAEQLARLFVETGLDAQRAVALAATLAEARSEGLPEPEEDSEDGSGNLQADSSFSDSFASLTELEELLRIPGFSREALYGAYLRDRQDRLVPVGGLYKHLTMRSEGTIDANYATPEVLRAAGVPDAVIARILEIRAVRPLRRDDFPEGGIGTSEDGMNVGVSGAAPSYTLWATAELRNGGARRTVGALVRRARPGQPGGAQSPPIRVARWYDVPF